MRLGVVRGRVVLSVVEPSLRGTRFLVVEPITAANLAARRPEAGGGKALIVADQLNPAAGEMVAFVEGREAANPYHPEPAPVDAYCSLIANGYDFLPPEAPSEEQP
jgi:carbon dioxide concentrating mechanism protein CcmL